MSPREREIVNVEDRLIVALNQPTVEEAITLVGTLGSVVSFYKVGLQLQMMPRIGDLIGHLLRSGKRVFLDYKYYDTVETVGDATERAARLGVTFLTVHGNRDIIRAAVEARAGTGLKILAVTVLTSLDAADLEDMFGRPVPVADLVLHRAAKALEYGCDGVVASIQEAKAIHGLAQGRALAIVTPGVRLDGAGLDDHKRAGTPQAAITAGASYLVVGRPIINAADPVRAAGDFIAAMRAAFAAHTQ